MTKDKNVLSKKLEICVISHFSTMFKEKEKVEALIKMFKDNILNLINSINSAIKEKNTDKVLNNLHSFKGVLKSGNLNEQGQVIENIEKNFKMDRNFSLLKKDLLDFIKNLSN